MKSTSLLPRSVLLALVFVAASGCSDGGGGSEASGQVPATPRSGPAPPSGTAWVIFGADTVTAEVAQTAEERSQGLMFRDELDEGAGMLFVFSESRIQSFWMRNTYIPLDIGFMDADFRVVDIKQMEPLDETFTESSVPALFALEVPQGWFERHDVSIGAEAEVVFGAR